jgi:hypothetical protein
MSEPYKKDTAMVDWGKVAQSLFSWKRAGQFLVNRVPQIFLIWAAVGLLLKLPLFVGAFGWFAQQANSPFYRVDAVSADQPVDITPIFLIGAAGLFIAVIVVMALYACIKLSFKFLRRRPDKVEGVAARFAGKLTDELSSAMTHCSAAILVLMVSARSKFVDPSTFLLCGAFFAVTFVFAAICYREDD